MYGIFGYVGARPCASLLVDGLTRLEYRGYDSAGVAILSDGALRIVRAVGNVRGLSAEAVESLPGAVGIGHTRWATHGRPSVENAHPHTDCTGGVAVVHNGIIENHAALREELVARGHRFRSETDTEVVAHLVEECWGGSLDVALRKAAEQLHGDYALAVLHAHAPGAVAAMRAGSPPLLVGLGEGERFLGSDVVALAAHVREVLPLEDGDVALLTEVGVEITPAEGGPPTPRRPIPVGLDPDDTERGGHPHYMHKEIYEQPEALRRALGRMADLAGGVGPTALASLSDRQWADVRRVTLVACGTSYHAALLGRSYFESLAGIPADADISSEFRYREPPAETGTLCIVISQSGETADTLGALQVARARGNLVVGICNVPGSSLTREADAVLMTATGPEIGVASTKTFTAQVVALLSLALAAAEARRAKPSSDVRALRRELAALPTHVEAALGRGERVEAVAARFHAFRDVFFVGRGPYHPIALEGALKLKEIAYVRAEAFPAGEMKHGPLALIDPDTVTLTLAPVGRTHTRMLSTIEEVRARGGRIVGVGSQGDPAVPALADEWIPLPAVSEALMPVLLTIPLQLFAYHAAVMRGCDVDRPRNLAKSVTVE